jgi:flagellar biosynthesis chaperone FliJ
MASTIVTLPGHIDEASETTIEARQALDKVRKALAEAHVRLELTTKHEDNPDRIAYVTLLEMVGEQLNTLERYLAAMETEMQSRRTNTASAHVSGRNRKYEELSGSKARYMVVVLLLTASLISTLFALFFLSTRK